MNEIFEIAGGSVIGREHRLAGRNNQDAYYWMKTENLIIALVSDGCTGGQYCEVGSRLGIRLVAEAIRKNSAQLLEKASGFTKEKMVGFLESVRQDVLNRLKFIAISLGNNDWQAINDFLLFTLLGCVITPEFTTVFSLGDGVFWINSQIYTLGPYENNEPPYLAYGLVDSTLVLKPEFLQWQIHSFLPTNQVQTVMIATDGIHDFVKAADKKMPGKEELVGPVSQFWEEDGYFENQDKVRRKLFLVNRDIVTYNRQERQLVRENGLLRDDTTVVVIRRKKEKGDPEINQKDPSTSSGSRR